MTGQRNGSKHSLVTRVTFALTALVAMAVLAACFSAYEIHKLMGERMVELLAQGEARNGHFHLLYDAVDIKTLTHDFGVAMTAIALGFVVFSYLCARRLAKWAVQPIQAVTAHLSRWAPGQPQALGLRSNEGLQLTEAFNRMQRRVDRALADQKEFSSNFNHEVRAPLSLIRTDAELAKRSAVPEPALMERLERIMRSADQIAASLEATYHMAQADHGEAEPTSLKECVDDVFASMEAEASAANLNLHNQVSDTHYETVNRHMLRTVIRNIASNAILHAAPGNFDVSSNSHGLRLSDDGPGVSPADAPYLFDRYYSGRRVDTMPGGRQQGSRHAEAGLGLAIAGRACSIQGWSLELDPSESGGVVFILNLRPRA